ncbi:hypothetical protein GCM10009605_38130 [Nocardiopsis composta]
MTALATEAGRGDVRSETADPAAKLFQILDDLPETKLLRAEILDGETITLSPTPSGLHGRNVRVLERALGPHLPSGTDYETYLEIRLPEAGRGVVPDFFVAPMQILKTKNSWIPPDDVLLVAEVVSPGSRTVDWELKPEIYAKAMIDLYLLIDPVKGDSTLFAQPDGERFGSERREMFGAKIGLPDPFNIQLDTSQFLPYE